MEIAVGVQQPHQLLSSVTIGVRNFAHHAVVTGSRSQPIAHEIGVSRETVFEINFVSGVAIRVE